MGKQMAAAAVSYFRPQGRPRRGGCGDAQSPHYLLHDPRS